MKCWVLTCAALAAALPAHADILTATRAIRPMSVLTAADLNVIDGQVAGALSAIEEAVGLETRITLYPGRPIHPGDLGPPALVTRNQPVPLVYQSGALVIVTDGRALGRAAAGEWVRVMNAQSKTTVTGRVALDGRVMVSSKAH